MKFELKIDKGVELAETPIWDARVKCLYWTDLFTGQVHRYHPDTDTEQVFETGGLIGAAIPCEDESKLMVAIESGMHLFDMETGALSFIADPNEGNAKNRYNDTRVDARGRIFTSTVSKLYGSTDYTPDMLGSFYMIDTDKSVKTLVSGINQYNAIVWNRDDTRMFVVDTYNQKLTAFDYDIETGPVSGPKEVIDFSKQGMPDGMSIDCEDNLYVCHWTGKISIWNKEFRLKKIVEFPVEYVCCTGFGGENMRDLYVASSRYCYTEEDLNRNPGAGGIFLAQNAVAGAREHFYK